MSHTKNMGQIQIFLQFRIILNKEIQDLLRLGTAFKNPTAFNDVLRLRIVFYSLALISQLLFLIVQSQSLETAQFLLLFDY